MANDVLTARIPVVRVSVLEDRARVIRRGSVTTPAGLCRVRIAGVAPVLVDKTLVARVVGAKAEVLDVHVHRRLEQHVADSDADEGSLAKVKAEGERLDREIAELLDRRTGLERRAAALDEAACLALDELAEDISWGRGLGGEWPESLAALSADERKLREDIFELSEQLKALYSEHDRLGMRLATLTTPTHQEAAEIEVVLQGDGAEIGLEVEYSVPGACWRPYHVATLRLAEGALAFRTDACIWQNTGEDWHDAELSFSTERPSLGTEVPELDDDILSAQRKSAQVVVETREQEVQTTGLGSTTAMVSIEVPGVDDGGEQVLVKAPSRCTVPSDGRPHRITLSTFEAKVETDLVAVPELSASVYLRSVQTNESGLPLLAGPVDLIRDSGFVGRTSVLYVASGERFELGWGAEAELRIKRMDETLREKSRILSSWTSRGYQVDIFLSNLGKQKRTVRVTERIPVSETDKVKVELEGKECSDGTVVDDHGFVVWHVDLAPFGQDSRHLRYFVRKHEGVVGI